MKISGSDDSTYKFCHAIITTTTKNHTNLIQIFQENKEVENIMRPV